jgi:hypothetical protein
MFEPELLINVGVKAAISAGKEIMNVYGGSDFQITSKEDRTPLKCTSFHHERSGTNRLTCVKRRRKTFGL